MNRDIASNVRVAAGTNGDSIDLREFDAVMVVATGAAVVEVSDVPDSGFTEAPAGDLITRTEGGATVRGYIGSERYLRVTGAGAAASVVVGHKLARAPQGFSVAS